MTQNNSIIKSLKRLERVGAENSRVTQKLKKSCEDLANKIVDICRDSEAWDFDFDEYHHGGHYIIASLSGDDKSGLVIFAYIEGGQRTHLAYYEELNDYQIGYPGYYSLMDADYITRERALKFSADVENGLLKKVTALIEKRKINSEKASKQLEKNV